MDYKSWKAQSGNSNQAGQNGAKSEEVKSSNAKSKTAEKAEFKQSTNSADNADIEEKINSYKGKSEDDLMKEMLSTASKLKGEGKLKASDVEEFYEKAKGFLNAEQLAKLRSLIKMLGV
ncbi:MAG TPA: hypothetical protein VJZ69_01120 [Clostridia bacterium]|nr:hypothetical protein [Clostridia bacterium]